MDDVEIARRLDALGGRIDVVNTRLGAIDGRLEDVEGSTGVHDRLIFEHIDDDGVRHPGLIEKFGELVDTTKMLVRDFGDAKVFFTQRLPVIAWVWTWRAVGGVIVLSMAPLGFVLTHWDKISRAFEAAANELGR